jgi:hypothetical protein
MYQAAANQSWREIRLRSKIVPVVTDILWAHAEQNQRPSVARHLHCSKLYSFTVKLAFVTCIAGQQLQAGLTAAPSATLTVTACVVGWAFSLHVFNVYWPGGTFLIV